jgi:sugar phosphate isomerase/epimerase
VIVDPRTDSRDTAYLSHLSREYTLPIVVLHSPFMPNVPGWPNDQLGRLERTIALAQELDVSKVVTHLPFRFWFAMGFLYGRSTRLFRFPLPWMATGPYYQLLKGSGLLEIEHETGVTIGVENMPSQKILGAKLNGYWFNNLRDLARFPHLTLDTTHLGTWDLDPLTVYQQLKDRIVHIHLANFDGREHRLPPDGHLNLGGLLTQLSKDNYQGTITVEADPSAIKISSDAECLEDLERALAFCREHLT